MNLKKLDEMIKSIQVINKIDADVEVVNHSPLVMIGKGRQGAVFQLSDDICVKVFGNKEDWERELYALSLGQHTNLFPKIYAKGPLYIAMEMIKGVDLREYLQSQPLTTELSSKLIEMLITFKEIGFERIDHHKRQIYLLPDGNLKVIDVARTVWRDRVYPYPRKLLTSLGEKNKEVFLSHVQAMAPELYEEWLHYIRMEDLSHQILQVLFANPTTFDKNKNLSKKLLTTNDEQKYVVMLEGLVHKIFKEEWIKTMLAQGYEPDDVMKKIDEYWESKEKVYGNDKYSDSGKSRDPDKNYKQRNHFDYGKYYNHNYHNDHDKRREHDLHYDYGKRKEHYKYNDYNKQKDHDNYYNHRRQYNNAKQCHLDRHRNNDC
jgi:predicted Ser/Thr protein kinase